MKIAITRFHFPSWPILVYAESRSGPGSPWPPGAHSSASPKTSSNASRRAPARFEPSSSELHRAKCGDGKQVAGDVGSLDASKRGGRKSWLEQIAHLLRGSGGDAARIELLDRFNCGEALRGRIFHRIEIFIGEQAE
jgi:hypothetical protein